MSWWMVAALAGGAEARDVVGCRLGAMSAKERTDHEADTVPATALFIFIGAQPRTEWVVGTLERDDMGFILTGPDLMKDGERPKDWPLRRQPFWLEASVPGIFVAGDVRHHSVKRMASAVGEGSMAVQFGARGIRCNALDEGGLHRQRPSVSMGA